MRKYIFLFLTLLAVLLLPACAAKDADTVITVLVEDGAHYEVDVAMVTLEPGGNAAFYIKTDRDYAVTAANYRGEYNIRRTRGMTKLELWNVHYPTRVSLTLSRDFRTISYEANGGAALTGYGTSVTETYDVSYHIRPNVSIGTDLFSREGHTLVCWNTAPDGSGQRVGLGSRMSVDEPVTLYAQWAEWTPADCFAWKVSEGGTAVITACTETGPTVVVPELLDGRTVTGIAAKAFANCPAETVILPKTLVRIEKRAFSGAKLRELCFYDNIEYITDDCFPNCKNFSTLRINAIEDPYGYSYRRESVLADKLDVLIETMGEDRLIFYGGCSMWYNLNGDDVEAAYGDQYQILDMAVNGLTSSLFQMELLRCFVTEHDVLIHTPEISSEQQLMLTTAMAKNDSKTWCAMEYNYDLVSLIDIRLFEEGVLETLRVYLDKKAEGGTYADVYRDSKGNEFFQRNGTLSFLREARAESLSDSVYLDSSYLEDLSRLEEEYRYFTELGVPIYVTFACIDIDDVPAEQRANLGQMGELFLEKFSAMDGVTVFGNIEDFVYETEDFYDTVYHLLTVPARQCTAVWLRDLTPLLVADGLLEE